MERCLVGSRGLVAATCVAGLVWCGTGRLGKIEAAAQATIVRGTAAIGPPGTLRANVAIRHRRVLADGRAHRATLPPITLRLDRRQDAGRWKTTLTFDSPDQPRVQVAGTLVSLDNPFLVSRIEYDEEEGEPKMYDRVGRRLGPPKDEDRRLFGITPERRGSGWDPRIWQPVAKGSPGARVRGMDVTGFVAEVRHRETRRADLNRRFGRAVGRVRGLDRFLLVEGRTTQEVLVSGEAALPVEVNTLTDGVLASRTELRYDPYGTVGHLRQFMRAEQSLPDQSRDRVITEVELSNVTMVTGGAR